MPNPIPEGYRSVTPYLIVENAAELIEFMSKAFGATERMRLPGPDGKIAHAEVNIGDSMVMLSDGSAEYPPNQSMLHLYVEDVDAVYQKAVDAGAAPEREPENQFYGDRSAIVRDKFGNRWSIATTVEDVSEEEMMKRMNAMGIGQS